MIYVFGCSLLIVIAIIAFFITLDRKEAEEAEESINTNGLCDHCFRVSEVWGASPNCSDCPYERGSSIVGDDLLGKIKGKNGD